jgi:hypothetical protein
MSVAKHIEITASSTEGFEDACRKGVARAAQTLNQIEGAWVQDQKVVVKDGEVVEFRVNLKVTFVLED